MWAVAATVAGRTDGGECTVATTGHGREALFDDLDVSRTTGWFQVLYPLRLQLPATADPPARCGSVIRQLAQVPDNGIGYGLLRHLCPDDAVRAQVGRDAPPHRSR